MINICGGSNHLKITEKPDYESGYKMIVPYKFKDRHKIGKVECDCNKMLEIYQPFYGFSWYHMEECALLKHLEKHPQIANLIQFWDHSFKLIAQSE